MPSHRTLYAMFIILWPLHRDLFKNFFLETSLHSQPITLKAWHRTKLSCSERARPWQSLFSLILGEKSHSINSTMLKVSCIYLPLSFPSPTHIPTTAHRFRGQHPRVLYFYNVNYFYCFLWYCIHSWSYITMSIIQLQDISSFSLKPPQNNHLRYK